MMCLITLSKKTRRSQPEDVMAIMSGLKKAFMSVATNNETAETKATHGCRTYPLCLAMVKNF